MLIKSSSRQSVYNSDVCRQLCRSAQAVRWGECMKRAARLKQTVMVRVYNGLVTSHYSSCSGRTQCFLLIGRRSCGDCVDLTRYFLQFVDTQMHIIHELYSGYKYIFSWDAAWFRHLLILFWLKLLYAARLLNQSRVRALSEVAQLSQCLEITACLGKILQRSGISQIFVCAADEIQSSWELSREDSWKYPISFNCDCRWRNFIARTVLELTSQSLQCSEWFQLQNRNSWRK